MRPPTPALLNSQSKGPRAFVFRSRHLISASVPPACRTSACAPLFLLHIPMHLSPFGIPIPFTFPFPLIISPSRYYTVPNLPSASFPPQLHDYNSKFTKTLENIKRRHDPTVTTVAQGVLEWKHSRGKAAPVETPREIQDWLDRFYMSRIGIRFLIGQREFPAVRCC